MKNFKKIAILTILVFFFIVIIQGSYAANATINNSTSIGTTISNVLDDGDTLTLQPGIYYQRGITVYKNFTIQGNGSADRVVIDAQRSNRIFLINGAHNVTFINITFKNGNSSLNGGAVFAQGSSILTFIDCTFINNRAENGGAIFTFSPGTLNIFGCTFINNTATNRGGAIEGHNVNISFSVFYNNTATDKVIYNRSTSALKDNFYFWSSSDVNSNLQTLLTSLTNTPSIVDGFYYLDFTTNTVSYAGEILNINSLSYYGASPPAVNLLPALDIILDYNGQKVDNYDYRTESGVLINSLANTFTYLFLGDTLHTMTLNNVGKGNTTMVVSPVSGKVGDVVQLRANLTSHEGNPISGAIVFFYVNGKLVGNNTTRTDGIAIFNHLVQDLDSDYFANFTGNEVFNAYQSLSVVLTIVYPPVPTPGPTPTPNQDPETDDPDVDDDTENDIVDETNDNSVASATMKNTGIPIIAVLFMLLASLSFVVSRKK